MLNRIFYLLLLISLVFLYSCNPELIRIRNLRKCTSLIEGSYYSQLRWGGKVPALLYKENQALKVVYGTVLEENENGFLFKQSSVKDSSDLSTMFFSKEKTTAVINKNREVVYGEVDKKFLRSVDPIGLILHIARVNSKNRFYKELVLKPNTTFAFCLKPGKYIIKDMFFENKYEGVDKGIDFPDIYFEVLKNHTTYIGDLYLDDTQKSGERIVVPYINAYTSGELLATGVFFGLIGEIAYLTIKSHLSSKNIHVLSVAENRNFEKKSKLNLNIDLLHVPDSSYNVDSFPLHEISPQLGETDSE